MKTLEFEDITDEEFGELTSLEGTETMDIDHYTGGWDCKLICLNGQSSLPSCKTINSLCSFNGYTTPPSEGENQFLQIYGLCRDSPTKGLQSRLDLALLQTRFLI